MINSDVVEKLVHEKLKEYRIPNKEFFRMPVHQAIHAVQQIAEEYRQAKQQ